jgi:tetratricopeptide (TPR) repeat protein
MQMFLDQQVRESDPSLRVVRDSFRRNLDAIVDEGRKHGAKIVLSTVACNLKDCAPFGSLHRADLASADLVKWEKFSDDGISAQAGGKFAEALEFYRQAAKLDDTYAALRFREGECLLALGQDKDALEEFARARDLDTLRFRCDSGLNEIIRKEANRLRGNGHEIILADAEAELARQAEHGIPGGEFFYEHVHFKFDGNYRLALTLGEQIAKLLRLPEKSGDSTGLGNSAWPSREACARRLAWTDFDRYQGASQMVKRLNDPPFTAQEHHAEQLRSLQQELEQLLPATQPAGLTQAAAQRRAALALAPDDWVLHRGLGELQQKLGDYSGAATSCRRVTELLPDFVDGWEQLGTTLEEGGHLPEALSAFQRALTLEPDSPVVNTSIGQLYAQQHKYPEAIRCLEMVLRAKPYWQPAHFELGKVLEAAGRKDEAEAHFQQALQNRIHTPEAYTRMGQFCFERGWYDRAISNFTDALRLDAADAANHVNLGVCFLTLSRRAEARAQFAEAMRLDPNLAEAQARLGLELGRDGDNAAALEHFQQAARLKPDVIEFRLNLAIALSKQQRIDEARAQFQEVLRRSPTNAIALKYLNALP